MNDFSTPGFSNLYGLPPTKANTIAPGKRPSSSMAPIIFVDQHNQVRLVVGASGGSRIISAIAQVRPISLKNDRLNITIYFVINLCICINNKGRVESALHE